MPAGSTSVAASARRFRALWVFRHALAGLGASVPDPSRLQSLQSRLSGGSDVTTTSRELDELARDLLAADGAIAPGQLRRFLQRASSYDDAVLLQLVEVYLAGREGDGWPESRLDKLGYVLTRLAERRRVGAPLGLDQRGRLREAFAWIWAQLEADGVTASPADVESACHEIEAMRAEVTRAASLAELREGKLVSRYRERKASLGPLLFHPDVLVAALETNLALKEVMHDLYRREEARIFTDAELVLALEADLTAPADAALRAELDEFHAAVRRFEDQLRGDDLKIDQAADLHARALGLLQRIG